MPIFISRLILISRVSDDYICVDYMIVGNGPRNILLIFFIIYLTTLGKQYGPSRYAIHAYAVNGSTERLFTVRYFKNVFSGRF